jgi:hypothetical protein
LVDSPLVVSLAKPSGVERKAPNEPVADESLKRGRGAKEGIFKLSITLVRGERNQGLVTRATRDP